MGLAHVLQINEKHGATTGSRTRSSLLTKLRQKLTVEEKLAYIQAELCLMRSPSRLFDWAQNRWDELAYGHIVQFNIIHNVGAFLPWHRLYIRAHEQLLQTECNYTGAQP